MARVSPPSPYVLTLFLERDANVDVGRNLSVVVEQRPGDEKVP